jgi:aspartate 1-decarboxylase
VDLETAMLLTMLKAKIHGVRVTQADLNYYGSITIAEDLMLASGILNNESVLVADLTNGNRLTTYAIPGPAGSGVIGMNGAAAHLIHPGDEILVLCFAQMTPDEAKAHKATILLMNPENNTIRETLRK